MQASGVNPATGLVEIIEIPDHPFFIASQFHPEYASTVLVPHPLFVGFVKAARHRGETTHASSSGTEKTASHNALT
jgi:CTP synthase